MQAATISQDVLRFITDELLNGDDEDLEPSSPLLEWGVIDSASAMSLLSFIENRFGVRIAHSEITPRNFRNVERIASMVVEHASRPASMGPDGVVAEDPEIAALLEFGARTATTSLESGASVHGIEIEGPEPRWILIPEPGDAATAYADVQRALEGHCGSLAVDLPGFGISTAPDPAPGFWEQARILAELVRQKHGERPVVLVGHGLAGAVALEVARRVPARVHATIVLGFGVLGSPRSLLSAGSADVESFLAARRYAPAASHCVATGAGLAKRIAQPAFSRFLDSEAETHLSQGVFETAATPVLYIGALDDGLVDTQAIERAAELTPHARVKWLARAGHSFPTERADETTSLMLSYVQHLQSRGAA